MKDAGDTGNMEDNKAHHVFDLKLPLGVLLAFVGAVLFVYGLLTKPEFYAKSLGINVNLWWGALLLAIGVAMIGLFVFKKKKRA